MQTLGMTPLESRLLQALRHIESLGASTENTNTVAAISDAIACLQAMRYANPGGSTAWGLDGKPNPIVREAEQLAKALRGHTHAGDGQPEGTLESIGRCARMIDTYTPDTLPANEYGQIDFARAMLESTADEIKAYVAKQGG